MTKENKISEGLEELRTYVPEHLEHIARITEHMRNIADNYTNTQAALNEMSKLSHVIDGILIGAGLEYTLPDYALENAINKPQYEAFAAHSQADQVKYDDEVHEKYLENLHDLGLDDGIILLIAKHRYQVDVDEVSYLGFDVLEHMYQFITPIVKQGELSNYLSRVMLFMQSPDPHEGNPGQDVHNAIREVTEE